MKLTLGQDGRYHLDPQDLAPLVVDVMAELAKIAEQLGNAGRSIGPLTVMAELHNRGIACNEEDVKAVWPTASEEIN